MVNPSSVNQKPNFCLERDGVPQDRPLRPRDSAALTHVPASPSHDDDYRKRRTERRAKSLDVPQKRTRPSEAHQINEDCDVIEVEENTPKASAFHAHKSASNHPQRKRHSQRLEEKRKQDKNGANEYNIKHLRRDRMRRHGRRGNAWKGTPADENMAETPFPRRYSDPIVLDDEDERYRSASAKPRIAAPEQEEKGTSNRADFPKPTNTSEARIHDDVVRVEEDNEEDEDDYDEIKESKDSSAVDAPYTGSTELIFEFPPGQRGKIRVTEEERGRLIQKKYLNDSLIDFYIKYHETDIERRAHELRFTAVFFSSFFFGRLRRTDRIDYQGVRGWTKNVDIFSRRFVFVPICESYHWSLIIVANLDKVQSLVDSSEEAPQDSTEAPRIIYLDSLDPKRGTEFGETMRHYLVEEWLAKRLGSERNLATRKATSARFKKIIPILRPNVPIQTNEYDCGLYVLNSFEMFLNNTDDLRHKLLSGCRDVRDAYSHVEIAMLRKSIINLMNILERQWTSEQVSTEKESPMGALEDEMSSTVFEFQADTSRVYHSGSLQNCDYKEDSDGGANSPPRTLTHHARQDDEFARYSPAEHEADAELVTVLDGDGKGGEGQLDVPNTGYVKMDVENSTDADG